MNKKNLGNAIGNFVLVKYFIVIYLTLKVLAWVFDCIGQ